jgi:hypothetical protein
MVVGNTNITVEHLTLQFEVIVISFVERNLAFGIWYLTLKVTNLELYWSITALDSSSRFLDVLSGVHLNFSSKFSLKSRLWTHHTLQISCLNLTSHFASFVFLFCRLTSSGFTSDSSTPTLKRNNHIFFSDQRQTIVNNSSDINDLLVVLCFYSRCYFHIT